MTHSLALYIGQSHMTLISLSHVLELLLCQDVGEEEHFEDCPSDGEGPHGVPSDSDESESEHLKTQASVSNAATSTQRQRQQELYNALHRNPLYCNAERSCSWEIRQV